MTRQSTLWALSFLCQEKASEGLERRKGGGGARNHSIGECFSLRFAETEIQYRMVGSPRFELESLAPEARRMDQATPRPR